MGFTFAARTLLELGKELISSDEVALYELIKNAVDAQSPRVEISVHYWLKSSDYREAIALIEEEGKTASEVKDFLWATLDRYEDPPPPEPLDQLCDCPSEGFLEEFHKLYNELNFIEVRDTGHGMSLHELSDVFLRIGTRSRRNENLEGARYLGDKGIGRLSAMRLGDRLQVKTTRIEDRYWNLLDIDWTLFSQEDEVDASAISIEPEIGDNKAKADEHGTAIRISALHGDWDLPRFTDILQGRIARMVDPFESRLANRLIVARHNGTRVQVPSIPHELLQAAHAVCHVKFRIDGETPTLEGEVRYRQRTRRIAAQGGEIASLAQEAVKRRAKRGHAAYKLVPVRLSTFKRLGNFSCDIFWFNRRIVAAIDGLSDKAVDTRREISHWSGGPMLYRYGFRILPYGDPDDDWLALDQIAFGESGFKLNRQQVLGRVLIETPHEVLSEQTNREGLVNSDSSGALQNVLKWVIHTEMRGLINEVDNIERIERRKAEEDTRSVSNAKIRVSNVLDRLRKHVGDAATDEIEELSQSVERLTRQSQSLVARIEAVIKEADEEREKFVYLAGIGLMTEFIFHELERAVFYTLDVISHGAIQQTTIESLREQLKTLHKRISAFDKMTTEKRQRKSNFDLVDTVCDMLENHAREFERHGIVVQSELPPSYKVKAVPGMVIQILENLFVNSAYWLKQQKRFELNQFQPTLTVTIDGEDKTLTVEDNGPGVVEDRRERIFQPFITTKPVGQGRGLGLYIARDMAKYHGWTLQMDHEIGRIREGRINMFVLKMGK